MYVTRLPVLLNGNDLPMGMRSRRQSSFQRQPSREGSPTFSKSGAFERSRIFRGAVILGLGRTFLEADGGRSGCAKGSESEYREHGRKEHRDVGMKGKREGGMDSYRSTPSPLSRLKEAKAVQQSEFNVRPRKGMP